MFINFILLVFLQVAFADVSSGIFGDLNQNCNNPLHCSFDLEYFRKLPFSKPELDAFCNEVMNYFDCLDSTREHFELGDDCEFLVLMLNVEKFLRTSCNTKSFRNHYLEHVKCFKKIFEANKECDKHALYRMMLYDVANKDQKIPEHSVEEVRKCMVASLKATCFGERIDEECGFAAFKVYKEIFDGTQIYSQYCPGHAYQLAKRRSAAILEIVDRLLLDDA